MGLRRRAVGHLRRFAREERGALAIEAVIMLPALVLVYVAGYQYFDQYRREAQMTKASYAVADMLSRHLGIVTPRDLDGLERVYETLTDSPGDSFMRFSEVRRTGGELRVIWSYATDGQPALTPARLEGHLSRIPRLEDNERVTLVEAYTYDDPLFDVGLGDRIVPSFVPMRQRYAARLAFAPDTAAPDGGSVIANDTDCGGAIALVAGVPLVGVGNCAGE